MHSMVRAVFQVVQDHTSTSEISSTKIKRSQDRSFSMTEEIKVITKLPNSEQSYKGKVQTHNYINRQNQSTTGKL